MKKIFLTVVCIFYLFVGKVSADTQEQLAWMGPVMMGGGYASAAAGYCAGTELFCSTFESTTSWDAANGTSDCEDFNDDGSPGSDGDYCDGVTYTGLYAIDSKSFCIRGASTYYVEKNLSTADQGEYYVEAWIRFDDAAQNQSLLLSTSTNVYQLGFYLDAGGTFVVYTHDGASSYDTNYAMSADTYYHVGVYFKVEDNDLNDNGILRVWINTSTSSGFTASDYQAAGSSTSANTGVTLTDKIRLRGEAAGETECYDNVKVVSCSGTPWAYE